MKIAAYQAPLLPAGSMLAVELIRQKLDWCEANGVSLLCCPEAVLGGLADDAAAPQDFALRVDNGQLAAALSPLASGRVSTVIGFTETTAERTLYNSVAVLERGRLTGIYRKRYPPIRQSVYAPGQDSPIFTIDGLRFGILICNDSNFPDLAVGLAQTGAELLLVPTNNALRPEIAANVQAAARQVDAALAIANGVPIVRADVAGRSARLLSLGSSAMTDARGVTQSIGRPLEEMLLLHSLADLR